MYIVVVAAVYSIIMIVILKEKEFLIRTYLANDNTVSLKDFCRVNKITDTTFRKWLNVYSNEGIEGLARADKNKYPILTGGEAENTENLKREILKLRIENERLKKNYTAQQNQDGKIIYTPLKEKNSQ